MIFATFKQIIYNVTTARENYKLNRTLLTYILYTYYILYSIYTIYAMKCSRWFTGALWAHNNWNKFIHFVCHSLTASSGVLWCWWQCFAFSPTATPGKPFRLLLVLLRNISHFARFGRESDARLCLCAEVRRCIPLERTTAAKSSATRRATESWWPPDTERVLLWSALSFTPILCAVSFVHV